MLYLLLAISSASGGPAPPLWPTAFMLSFTENTTLPNVFGGHTTGTYYYNWTAQRYRVDRADGQVDRYCGVNGEIGLFHTPCSHIVANKKRYLYYPEHLYCCLCCSADRGCGILSQNWLEGAQFLGEELHLGQPTYKWNKAGFQSNLYYETVAESPLDRHMVSLYQEPNDRQNFYNFNSELPSGALDLPRECEGAKQCSVKGTCHLIENS